jgi:hypothetical protein
MKIILLPKFFSFPSFALFVIADTSSWASSFPANIPFTAIRRTWTRLSLKKHRAVIDCSAFHVAQYFSSGKIMLVQTKARKFCAYHQERILVSSPTCAHPIFSKKICMLVCCRAKRFMGDGTAGTIRAWEHVREIKTIFRPCAEQFERRQTAIRACKMTRLASNYKYACISNINAYHDVHARFDPFFLASNVTVTV